jgi:hypothetical protein
MRVNVAARAAFGRPVCFLGMAIIGMRLIEIPCHPEPQARDLLVDSLKQSKGFSSRPVFRSLSRASYFSLLVHCAACGANGAADPKGEYRRCESRKGNQKKAFPAHARGAWALSHPRASGA